MLINLYEIDSCILEYSLSKLLEKLVINNRIVIQTKTEDYCYYLNNFLWTYSANSFLPHGVYSDRFCKKHPICLTYKNENPNNANILILIHRDIILKNRKFDRIFDFCFSNNHNLIKKKLEDYKQWDCNLIYWTQDNSGLWNRINLSSK